MRTRRRLWAAGGAGLLALAFTVVLLWVTAQFRPLQGKQGELAAMFSTRRATLIHSELRLTLGPRSGNFTISGLPGGMIQTMPQRRLFPGVSYSELRSLGGGMPMLRTRMLYVRYEVPIAVLLVTAALCTWRWRRLKRLMRRGCHGCGYDLSGISARCPECGLELPAAPAVAGHDS
jgi:hypothetical protein